jgi:hypothetical protein
LKPPWPYKLFLLGVFSLLYFVFYVYPNFRPIFEPRTLPMLDFERAMPFLPWTVVIYTSDYFFMGCVVALLTERRAFHAFARQTILVLMVAGFFFWFFPTSIRRPELSAMPHPAVGWILGHVWTLDAPTNCFPSLHVAFTAVGLWNLRGLPPRLWSGYFVWACLIVASVLTTKQHYFWDIPAGFGLVLVALSFDKWLYSLSFPGRWLRAWEKTHWWEWRLPW